MEIFRLMNRPSDPEYREVMPAIEKLVSEHKSTLIAGDPQLNICDQSVMVRILLKWNRIDNLNPFRLHDFFSHSLQSIGVPSAFVPGHWFSGPAWCSSQRPVFQVPLRKPSLRVVSNFGKRQKSGQNICTLAWLGEPARGAPRIRDHSEFKKTLNFPSPRPLCPIPHLKLRILPLCVPCPLSLTVW